MYLANACWHGLNGRFKRMFYSYQKCIKDLFVLLAAKRFFVRKAVVCVSKRLYL